MGSGNKYWDDLTVVSLTSLPQYSLSVNVAPAGSGSVTKNPDQAIYSPGDVVELTAIPDASWVFDGWSGDAAGLDNPISITVDADLVIDANFVSGPVEEYALDVTTVGSGQVTLNPAGGIYAEGTVVELTAAPAAGWAFDGWSEDLTGTVNPVTLTMDTDKNVTATFALGTTPPVILTQPADQTVSEGQTATFSVTASGTGTLFYQWQRDGLDIPGAEGSSYTTPPVTLLDDGADFRCVVTDDVGTTTSDYGYLTVLPPGVRVTDGLVVLYGFQEGAGATVDDVSMVSPALDLTIQDSAAVSWLPGGGLAINAPTLISSAGAATKVIDAVKASGEITIEAWIAPANTTQDGPARIVTCSADAYSRNFTLGQGVPGGASDAWDVRMRTTGTGLNGTPSLSTDSGTLSAVLTHVVYTRDSLGVAKIYVDGVEQVGRAEGGDFSNWDSVYALALGNELSGDRPWLGEYYLVAIFDRALSQAEVQQNFGGGPLARLAFSPPIKLLHPHLRQRLTTFLTRPLPSCPRTATRSRCPSTSPATGRCLRFRTRPPTSVAIRCCSWPRPMRAGFSLFYNCNFFWPSRKCNSFSPDFLAGL